MFLFYSVIWSSLFYFAFSQYFVLNFIVSVSIPLDVLYFSLITWGLQQLLFNYCCFGFLVFWSSTLFTFCSFPSYLCLMVVWWNPMQLKLRNHHLIDNDDAKHAKKNLLVHQIEKNEMRILVPATMKRSRRQQWGRWTHFIPDNGSF